MDIILTYNRQLSVPTSTGDPRMFQTWTYPYGLAGDRQTQQPASCISRHVDPAARKAGETNEPGRMKLASRIAVGAPWLLRCG
jgi:hypothetical protein